jgi:hypothetical protein
MTDQYKPTLLSTITRLSGPHGGRKLDDICRLLKITEQEANNQFTQKTRKTLKDAKIHAEIQLIFYLETEGSEQPPRVICSSKNACFLCNAFIKVYGKIYVARSHGKLYTGWRLPLFPNFSYLEQRFVEVLENYSRKSLAMLLSRRRKTVYPDPNESTVLTLPFSVSTIGSLVLPDGMTKEERLMQPQQTNSIAAQNNHSLSGLESMSASSESKVSMIRTEVAIAMTEGSISTTSDSISSTMSSSQDSSSEGAVDQTSNLIQGHAVSKSIGVGCTSQLHTTGPLKIQIEYSAEPGPTMSRSNPRRLAYSIKWLTMKEIERLHEHQAAAIIDGESLEGESAHESDESNCLYIAGGGSILQIHLH